MRRRGWEGVKKGGCEEGRVGGCGDGEIMQGVDEEVRMKTSVHMSLYRRKHCGVAMVTSHGNHPTSLPLLPSRLV